MTKRFLRDDKTCWACQQHKADTWLQSRSGNLYGMCKVCASGFPQNWEKIPMVITPDVEAETWDA